MIAADPHVGLDPSPAAARELGGLYSPPRSPVMVDVPQITFLAVDGAGAPETSLAWAEALDRLRGAAAGDPAGEAPLEILHHADGRWSLLLAVGAPRTAGEGGGPSDPVQRRTLHERWSAQLLHTGDAAGQDRAWHRLERFAADRGYLPDGPRHEVVLDAGGRRRRILRLALRPLQTD